MTTYADLITAKTAATLFAELIDRLEQAAFPIDAWVSGSVPRSLVQVDVETLAELYRIVVQIGKAWSLDDVEGPWLTLHAWSRYRVPRILATFARHTMTLTVASGAGPYTITPGQLVLTRSDGVRFRSVNTTNVTVAHGTPQTITVQCETAGTTGNTQPTTLVTPALAGFSVTWSARTTTAVNEESDARLRQRCRDKWATLAPSGATRETYRYWITSATMDGTALEDGGESCGITRTAFPTPPGDGSVPVWVAGANGQVGAPQLAAAQAFVNARHPYTDRPTLSHATEAPVDVSGMTVRFKPGQNSAERRDAIVAAIDAYFAGLEISTLDAPVTVDEAGIKAAVYGAVPGKLKDVDWSGSDSTLSAGEIAVADGTGSIVFSE